MRRGLLIAPTLGASLAAICLLGARGAAGPRPPAAIELPVFAASTMTLAARPVITGDAVTTLTSVVGLRPATLGSFGQEADPHASGRLFVDTTDAGAVLATVDQQRVKLTVEVTPNTLDEANLEIRWEMRDPDDPATNADLDDGAQGGDNTGTPHELVAHWFVQADHAISNQIDRTPVDETTVVGEARTAISRVGNTLVSSVHFRYGDDGGDNYVIRAVLRQKTPGADLDSDDSGTLTVWRKRMLRVYAMTKPNDDVQTHAVGTSPGAFVVCITAGANGRSDTMVLGGDDQYRGETVQAGANGVVETTANSGGTSFDPAASVALYRGTYGAAAPNQRAYVDWEATNEQLDRPYVGTMSREAVRDYMHNQTSFVHGIALMSLLGVNAIEHIAGNASYPPHCGVAVGTLTKTAPAQLPKTDVHEVGHLLIGAFEDVGDFHDTHSLGQVCGFRQGLQDPVLCSRHASMLRDRVARDFGNGHNYFWVVNDSAATR